MKYMKEVLLNLFLIGSLVAITFQLSPILNQVNSVCSSISVAQGSVISSNIDPIEA